MTTQQYQLEVSRFIPAPPGRVFAAWTDPVQIVQWWGAGGVVCTEAEMDLSVGGTYRINNVTPDGMTMWITGTFSDVDPPAHLAYTWAMEPITADTEFSLVEVTFTPEDDGTLVTVSQIRIDSLEAREMHLGGWIGCLEGLGRHLHGSEVVSEVGSMNPAEVVRLFFERMQERDWAGARALVATNARIEFTETGERFTGDRFVAMNEAYPEGWTIDVVETIGGGDRAAAQVRVEQGEDVFWCAGFYTVRAGTIVEGTEHWVTSDSSEPPEWRARFVTR